MKNIYGYFDIPGESKYLDYAKSDIEGVDFFLKRLDQAQGKNFVAVYYSYAAHWPYVDYGKEFRIFSDIQNRFNRYYNGLRMLDTRIKLIYDHLAARGILENTILVILGDHSEAFNQHQGNWIHARDTYNENVHTPCIFYNEKLFSPRRETRITSHADVLPTILDAAGVKYNQALFQGESLFSREFKRKYIFLFGNENSLTSFSESGMKLQMLFYNNTCRAFDLEIDPLEKNRLGCGEFETQKSTLMYYNTYQPALLEEYNAVSKVKKDFFGQTHPFQKK